MNSKNWISGTIRWWSKQTFNKCYLQNSCLLRWSYSLYTWGTEILRNSSSWRSYIHVLSLFPPGYGGESKQFSNPNISSLVAAASITGGRGTCLFHVGAHGACVVDSILISLRVLFFKHSHLFPWTQLSSNCPWLHVVRSLIQGPWPVLPTTRWLSPPWVYCKQSK